MVENKPSSADLQSMSTLHPEVTIARTEQRVMHGRSGNREYRIFVAKPREAPPPAGYPVIYLLDANSVFGTMVEALRVQGHRPEKTDVVPAVIVGIGYPTDTPFSVARHYDFTLPTSISEFPVSPTGMDWPEHGGAEEFLDFIEEILKPAIERDLPIDRSGQTIFGHSLGGLFVLQVLFSKPEAFQTYIAGSPSIHWNKPFIHKGQQQLAVRLEQLQARPALLLAVGELERTHKCGMNANAKELFEKLSAIAGHKLYVEFKEFADEGHISILPALISRALRFALSAAARERKLRI